MSRPADQIPQTENQAATPLRFVTAASLFDGHDAAMPVMNALEGCRQGQGGQHAKLWLGRERNWALRAAWTW